MFAKCTTAILMLLALLIEITIDPSTVFVRASTIPNVGSLVVVDNYQPQEVDQLPLSAEDQSSGHSNHDTKNLKHFAASAHVACFAQSESFFIALFSDTLDFFPASTYTEPLPVSLQRPPIV